MTTEAARRRLIQWSLVAAAAMGATWSMAHGQGADRAEPGEPAPPTNLEVEDHPLDKGDRADLTWEASASDTGPEAIGGYVVERAIMQVGDGENALVVDEPMWQFLALVEPRPADERGEEWDGTYFYEATALQYEIKRRELRAGKYTQEVPLDEAELAGVTQKSLPVYYAFRVATRGADGELSTWEMTDGEFTPSVQLFDGERVGELLFILLLSGAVLFFIQQARAGKTLKIRKIAGLAAVDEAVGRATEMGRSVLFIPGIQDMNDIQTIAGITVLSRVSKTAAEYDAKVEVPTSRSLVMTAARETVQASYLAAGRPDAFNPDSIYYVTDEQFGYVAYLQGMMVRDKPAACFYMGCFFAESLILAETGNSVGAIQVAGTAQPAQLPFFVAACDYTLIGEEFFAASAYLSGEPDQLGSLKGQDVGKVVVGLGIVVGVGLATLVALGVEGLEEPLAFIMTHLFD